MGPYQMLDHALGWIECLLREEGTWPAEQPQLELIPTPGRPNPTPPTPEFAPRIVMTPVVPVPGVLDGLAGQPVAPWPPVPPVVAAAAVPANPWAEAMRRTPEQQAWHEVDLARTQRILQEEADVLRQAREDATPPAPEEPGPLTGATQYSSTPPWETDGPALRPAAGTETPPPPPPPPPPPAAENPADPWAFFDVVPERLSSRREAPCHLPHPASIAQVTATSSGARCASGPGDSCANPEVGSLPLASPSLNCPGHRHQLKCQMCQWSRRQLRQP